MLNKRLLTKTLTYKMLTFISTVILFGAVTGSAAAAAGLSGTLLAVNTLIYYGHEWLWQKTDWGRRRANPS